MAPVLKTGIPERVSGVRIPPSPPLFFVWQLQVSDIALPTSLRGQHPTRGIADEVEYYALK
jgi:hypothetical protein